MKDQNKIEKNMKMKNIKNLALEIKTMITFTNGGGAEFSEKVFRKRVKSLETKIPFLIRASFVMR